MSNYTPDVWVILEISGSKVKETYRRVLAGWYGGYAGSDSWKISSGIEDIIDRGTYWEMPQSSGSVYKCYKESERFSNLTHSIYASYSDQNSDEIAIKHVPFEAPVK